MHRLRIGVILVCLLTSCLYGQDELPTPPQASGPFKSATDKTSYAIGLNLGTNMRASGVALNVEQVIQGFRDALGGEQSLLTPEQTREAILAFERQVAELRKKKGEEFLAANRGKDGVTTLPSGLQYKVLNVGTGRTPRMTDRVRTHYRGTMIDGTEFDSSYARGQPAVFPVAQVIRGWTEALTRMRVGDKWQIFVPSELAYGPQGAPPAIGPQEVLIFEIELLGIEN